MNPIEVKAKLVSALEEIATLRKDAKAGRPVDQTRYAAAIGFAATILDDAGRERLSDVIPSQKAAIQVDDLDAASSLLAELVDEWLHAHKASLPSKAFRDLPAESAAYHQPYADLVQRAVLEENAAALRTEIKARSAVSEADWVGAWLDHGENRLNTIRRMAQAAGR
ncbi:MAG: hypothetical protein M3Q66_11330 [Chloroflexota bacterium]|nr:hypothetical protein [Chloroflexota bacterium]